MVEDVSKPHRSQTAVFCRWCGSQSDATHGALTENAGNRCDTFPSVESFDGLPSSTSSLLLVLLLDSSLCLQLRLRRSIPILGRSSALKSPPTICRFFCRNLVIFSVELYTFSTLLVSVSRVERVHTHPCNPLLVDCDRCCNGTFVDVCGLHDLFPPLLVQEYCYSVLVFDATHMSQLCLLSISRKARERLICSL